VLEPHSQHSCCWRSLKRSSSERPPLHGAVVLTVVEWMMMAVGRRVFVPESRCTLTSSSRSSQA
jgi:hypothetical protein